MPILGNQLLRRQSVSYLLRDQFTTAASAPLASPRTAEPGPGTATITDTGNKLSIAGGILTSSTAGVAANDPAIVYNGIARASGRAALRRYCRSLRR